MMTNPSRLPSTETLESGPCPNCDRGSIDSLIFDACRVCAGTGQVVYPAVWSASADAMLREFLEAGRPSVYAAIQLRRPLAVVNARTAELRIVSPRGEPSPFVRVGVFMAKE